MEGVIQKWGNSLGVRIPNSIAKELHLENGSQVEIFDENGKIMIFPSEKKTLKDKLSEINLENIHSEINTGGPVGNEEW